MLCDAVQCPNIFLFSSNVFRFIADYAIQECILFSIRFVASPWFLFIYSFLIVLGVRPQSSSETVFTGKWSDMRSLSWLILRDLRSYSSLPCYLYVDAKLEVKNLGGVYAKCMQKHQRGLERFMCLCIKVYICIWERMLFIWLHFPGLMSYLSILYYMACCLFIYHTGGDSATGCSFPQITVTVKGK